jgi:hypothetical protein
MVSIRSQRPAPMFMAAMEDMEVASATAGLWT